MEFYLGKKVPYMGFIYFIVLFIVTYPFGGPFSSCILTFLYFFLQVAAISFILGTCLHSIGNCKGIIPNNTISSRGVEIFGTGGLSASSCPSLYHATKICSSDSGYGQFQPMLNLSSTEV